MLVLIAFLWHVFYSENILRFPWVSNDVCSQIKTFELILFNLLFNAVLDLIALLRHVFYSEITLRFHWVSNEVCSQIKILELILFNLFFYAVLALIAFIRHVFYSEIILRIMDVQVKTILSGNAHNYKFSTDTSFHFFDSFTRLV